MTYQPIEDYGIIGDMHSVALVGMDGSMTGVFPALRLASVFAAILDDEKGGRFKVSPASEGFHHQALYWPDTTSSIRASSRRRGRGVTNYMPSALRERHGYHQLSAVRVSAGR
jgi:hypothetical protein